MSVIVNALLILDGIVFLMVILDAISKKEFRTIFQRQNKVMENITEKTINEIEKEVNSVKRISLIIGTIIAIIVLFLFYTSIFTVPLYLWIRYDFNHALLGYVITNFFISIYIFKVKIEKIGIPNLNESQPIFLVISNLFRVLLLIVVYFGWTSNFQESMIKIYENFNYFNYIFVVLYPVLILGIVITNTYALINGLMLFRKDRPMKNEWRTKIKDILLIFVISSFVGLVYLSDNNLTFVSENDVIFINQNIDIVKVILTAIFIPLLFDRIVSCMKNTKNHTFNNEEANEKL